MFAKTPAAFAAFPVEELLDLERIKIFESLAEATGTDVVAELVGAFLASLAERLGELHQAILASELRQVEFLAHRLKGSSGNLGASGLQRSASHLEQAAIVRNQPRCLELWTQVAQIAGATERELELLLTARPKGDLAV